MGLRRPGQPPEPLKKTGKPLRQATMQRTALSGRYQNLCLDAKGFFEAKDYVPPLKYIPRPQPWPHQVISMR